MGKNSERLGEVLDTDVLIVGGGLAGNNAAIGAARKGRASSSSTRPP